MPDFHADELCCRGRYASAAIWDRGHNPTEISIFSMEAARCLGVYDCDH